MSLSYCSACFVFVGDICLLKTNVENLGDFFSGIESLVHPTPSPIRQILQAFLKVFPSSQMKKKM